MYINGSVWKVRNKNVNVAPIAKNAGDARTIIKTPIDKLDRPMVIFISNDKVYYLAIKTLNDDNAYSTLNDKTNIILWNGIYEDNHPSAVNTRAINVMDKDLFFSLFEPNSAENAYSIRQKTYNEIMAQLDKNIRDNNFVINEILGFTTDGKTTWVMGRKNLERNLDFVKESVFYYNSIIDDKEKYDGRLNNDFFKNHYENYLKEKNNNVDKVDLEIELKI